MLIPKLLLQEVCEIKRYKGTAPTGDIFMEEEPYKTACKYKARRKKVVTQEGEEFVTTGHFYLLPTEKNKQIKPSSIIYYNGEEMIVKSMQKMKGFADSHVVVII